ncbi:bifunctional glycosyltransferase/CDP-glycerol:glycerophosphate glycerophosphotransferase [Aeromicrobium massiliense]|uniref:bifunctional glycosyltransferase/CDP-glycerol:glycerophosphate glycerophosphotransferase n=1 Tax=Aeromicrobium massiliense TaxID=1464554 RepID=UPI0002E991DD|nr:CDP-glycerol glycerophosphotransferase family protein [Aeromicrobium massiliense]
MAKTPTYAVVVPVYNTARYLPDLLDSLERQTVGMDDLEIVLVDDGSTDESAAVIDAFAAKWPDHVVALHLENGGVAAARNAGMRRATAPWITFPDSDDKLSDDYFEQMTLVREQWPDVPFLAAPMKIWIEEEDVVRDIHPMRRKFAFGNRRVDLDLSPELIQMSAASAVFDRSVLETSGLEFDGRVVPRFEDSHFLGAFLLACDKPLVGLVSTAAYLYRRRADGTSTMQTGHRNERIYTDVPRFGTIDLLQRGAARSVRAPYWIQYMVLYDLLWLFKDDQRAQSHTASISPDASRVFHEHMRTIAGLLSREIVESFEVTGVPWWMREFFLFGTEEGDHRSAEVEVAGVDDARGLVCLTYRYTGEPPREEIFVRGRSAEARYSTTRQLWLMGRLVMRERVLWVSSAGRVQLRLDGEVQRLVRPGEVRNRYRLRPFEVRDMVEQVQSLRPEHLRDRVPLWRRLRQSLREERQPKPEVRPRWHDRLLRSWPVRRPFSHAWVLMDRDMDADDSAEVLYRWLRRTKPNVNAFYVQNRRSSDWDRLKKDRSVRLLRYGSWAWRAALVNADHLVSSHIDRYVVDPLPRARYGPPHWRYTFLQHGVIKGDISRWLNLKDIDVFVTSTQDEYDYIAGDSPFKFSPREVRLTGLPRFDDLLAASERVADGDRNLVVVMPTWREYLSGRSLGATNERAHRDDFMDSRYAQAWRAFLCDERLHAAADELGLQIAFMPHPNTQPYLEDFDLPESVRLLRYSDDKVRDVIAHAAIMVTDYSSIAFNMAYLHGPVVYFQFDRDDFYGSHIERPGYFDYEKSGFGPVTLEVDETVDAVLDVARRGGAAPDYLERIQRTFPVRDGRNCERVYRAIVETTRPLSAGRAVTAAPDDAWNVPTD